ncbi:hypothetical protein DFH08DRAFT_818194 [Mycena albidolilacea]|uniref:Uncharacterized protein n=1 Tax=Mycena albidolilacea TaxID=1033008 RepID=A0AAD6ZGJ1_9AGAR|nr:hypothetical protein DFH08DRAFT_818194 [Mycena albidolilacea]
MRIYAHPCAFVGIHIITSLSIYCDELTRTSDGAETLKTAKSPIGLGISCRRSWLTYRTCAVTAASRAGLPTIISGPSVGAALPRLPGVYIEDSGPRFWDSLDADLRKIRNRASGNARKLNKLTVPSTHGVDDYSIPSDIVNKVQHEVDATISAAATDKAATIPAAATEMGDPDEDQH